MSHPINDQLKDNLFEELDSQRSTGGVPDAHIMKTFDQFASELGLGSVSEFFAAMEKGGKAVEREILGSEEDEFDYVNVDGTPIPVMDYERWNDGAEEKE